MIESAQYIQNNEGENSCIKAVIDGDTWFVPKDATDNRHWQAIQKWVDEGNTIAEAD